MKRNLLIWMSALLTTVSCTQDDEPSITSGTNATTKAVYTDSLTVELDTVGALGTKIGDRANSVQKLILSGPINATDVETLRNLPNLVAVDMKNVTIVGDRNATYSANGYTYYLSNNQIGSYMFYGTQLSEIILPDSVTAIGSYAFSELRGTTDYLFKSITIPDNVSNIGQCAFRSCRYLEDVKLPASLQTIESSMFYACPNLKSVEIGDKVTMINGFAFYECTSLQSIELPESLKRIDNYCFSGSGLLTIEIPDSVSTLGGNAFMDCNELLSAKLPSSLTTIDGYTFYNCQALATVELPENLEIIDQLAFAYCPSLTSIDIPSTITTIQQYAFQNCTSLEEVTFTPSLHNITIGHSTFENTGLVSIELPDNAKNIGYACFQNCSSLQSVSLPSTLTSLSGSMFSGCSALESIEIPNSVLSIEYDCFYGCSSLKDITFSQMLETIGSSAFSNCSSLKNIELPNSLIEIGGYAFEYTGLTEVSLPENIETIGSGAFYYCSNLTTATIPASLKETSGSLFYGDYKLTAIFWNSSTDIPYSMISNPNCLLYLADANVQIGDSNLKNIIIDGVSEEITLYSSNYYEYCFAVPQEFKTKKISYTKSFNASTYAYMVAGWESISLPFTVTSITSSDGRILAPFNADAAEDAKPFWLRRLTDSGFENVTQIEAGIPYIISMPNNSAYDSEYNITGNVTFSAEDSNGITMPVTGEMTEDKGPAFSFNCNYSTLPASDDVYLLNDNYSSSEGIYQGSRFVRNEHTAQTFEAYVTSYVASAHAPAYYNIFGGSNTSTRSARPLGPVPSIDDM